MTKKRCAWSEGSFDAYVAYHDDEWGIPVHDDRTLFEFLILEGAQAGLSWATILKRREGYLQAFSNFDVQQVAKYDEKKVEELLLDTGIIRNKLKVRGTVTNARLFLEVQKEFGSFSKYLWSFVNHQPIINHWKSMSEVPVTTPESDAISKDLKKRGFKFVGSTIMYAYMQACGLVNDHTVDCFRYER
jgi:DNA-3-methyladenine glycosylase I